MKICLFRKRLSKYEAAPETEVNRCIAYRTSYIFHIGADDTRCCFNLSLYKLSI